MAIAQSNTEIFNGKDLTGWTVHGTEKWYVDKGELVCESGPDKQYAAVIGGIFDGTLPSYKALNPKFILKSLLQGTLHFGANTATGILQGPQYWAQTGKATSDLATGIIQSIRKQPKDHATWLAGVARKGLEVGGHIIRDIRK